MSRTPNRVVRYTALAAAAAALAVSGCSSGTPPISSGGTSSAVLTVVSGPTGPFVNGLSPFSTSDSPAFMGMTSLVYEPLIMFNAIAPTQPPKPWLASSFAWSNGGKTLTFTIPSGRTWSDGKPLTAADVAFTFDLLKKDPATNIQGITFTSASAPSPTTAVLTFAGPAYTQLFAISKVFIVPTHIWSSISAPQNFANPKPVGSGPYLLTASTPQEMTFTKNPHYWQAGLPKVQTVRVIDYTSQNAAINALSAGQIDWSTFYLANPSQQFTGSDPAHHKMWLVPAGDWFLCPNTAVKPFNNAAVRQALAYSIDRAKVIPQVEGQFYAPTSSPTGLRAGQQQFMPPALASASLSYDPAKVRKLLASAGFTASNPLKVSLMLPSPYTDWMSLGTLFVNEMKAAGIDASLDGVSSNTWTSDAASGNYQVTFCGVWSTSGPYFTYNTLLNSSLGAPVGKSAISNVVRWNNHQTDALLSSFQSTGSASTQTKDIQGLATIIAQQMPIIPLMSVSSFGQYSTKSFTGFPGAGNAYQTDGILNPYTEDVIIHLVPAK
ncbi:MAG TPA: ABC transporter substrate-binding protein [Streptosporangiaceae bacterium]|nr:ABC transporter substrate-binding protein [Streptosporangiaceae bacterium]